MIKEAILHMPLSQYAYATTETNFTLRIRTAKGDVESVCVYYGDRVAMTEPVPVTPVQMKQCARDDLFDYYEANIQTDFTRVCYYFSLTSEGKTYYYYSRGFCEQMRANRIEYFQFPYLRREELMTEPHWVYDSVMYHIFPDSFATSKAQLSGQPQSCGQSHSHLGGTIRGITENLDYLQSLGVNLIYLNPIFAANSYHKYDTIDYFKIDPCFGSKDDFRQLVKELHRRNMRIILDGVFNHCGPDFFAFRDVIANQKQSAYRDWFYQLNFPIHYSDPPNYECFAYVKEMPKLNTSHPQVRDFICQVGTYWIREFDIDGWRLDVANEVDHETWRAFRRAVRAIKPDAFLIAEIWEDADVWLRGDQFDSAMNYMFTNLCRDFFATTTIDARTFDEQFQKALMRYPFPIASAQMNFLDSHDVPRFLHHCGGNCDRLRLALFFLMTAPGIPSVFYGDECLLTGDTEPQYRAAMRWNPNEQPLKETLSEWIHLRLSHPSLTRGNYRSIYTDNDGGYAFKREYVSIDGTAETALVILNNSDCTRTIRPDDSCEPVTLQAYEGTVLFLT